MGDEQKLKQALYNLLSNAVKYAPADTPVYVALHGDTTQLWCDVRNSGPPVAEADREKIFERNYRGANSAGIAGTGIGLFMARTLARMQGGDVALHPGAYGVAFRLTLPLWGAGRT